jgi:hypothetical protein
MKKDLGINKIIQEYEGKRVELSQDVIGPDVHEFMEMITSFMLATGWATSTIRNGYEGAVEKLDDMLDRPDDNSVDEVERAMVRVQNLIESEESYNGKTALVMLGKVYELVREFTGIPPLSERYPELVGKIVDGGNRKENLE